MRLSRLSLLSLGVLLFPAPSLPAQTLLLRQPTVSDKHIAFAYANNIWIVDRAGGDARRLTSFQDQEGNPEFSPDGKWVAFSAQYGGNTDVYVVPVEGGEPVRLTWHPAPDLVEGWTPDGKAVVFASTRESGAGFTTKFYTVPVSGGLPSALPIPRGNQGKYSPDGKRFAYRMTNSWDEEWRNYRGGQNRAIWILDMASYELETPPWTDSKDIDPVWVGQTVYFLSDRDWLMNVWSYDTRAKQLTQVTRFKDYDVKSLGAGGGAVVFEQGGRIHLLDPATGQARPVPITVKGDFPWLEPQWKDVSGRIINAAISPTGKRAVFEARGEIFTVPAEKGDIRNITATPAVADRNPAWSPDGKWISYFSDRSGEYRLMLESQDGLTPPREIALPSPTFQFTPQWSPDSKKLLFTDTGLRLWVVDVASGRAITADTDNYMAPARTMNPVWSPDSRWIAYTKRLQSQYHAIFTYNLESGTVTQLTDGMSDAISPAWDASGKYLYFLASTNYALNTGWLDMTSYERPVTRAVYLAVLAKGEPSPLLPESDEEGAPSPAPAARDSSAKPANGKAAPAAPTVTVDFDGLAGRIISLNVTPREYTDLKAGAAGMVFLFEDIPATGAAQGPPPGSTLHRYQLKERKATTFLTGLAAFAVSADGKKLLTRAAGNNGAWSIVDADKAPPQGTAGRLNLSGMRMLVDQKAEFRQMLDEGWRYWRDFFYVPNLHGNDYVATKARYQPFVEHVRHRADFTYLLDMLGAEVAVGHSYVSGGDLPDIPQARAGLLGADYQIENGRYRIAKIYTGESWNPQLTGPLAGPGIDAAVGDYILAINGAELNGSDNIHRRLEGTAGRQTVLTLNSRPAMEGARQVTVVPTGGDQGLRQLDWVEGNRRKVDQLSGGKLAYVYVPNTGQPGYTFFNRYYFAQQDRPGVIIDERFNGGGSAADYMIEVMRRELYGYFNNAVGERTPFTTPGAGIWGPKVMIINEMAGSGGDLLPYMFRAAKLGPLVGKRTWGGLVGTWDTPPLLDGGRMVAPRGGFFDVDGKWAVENQGVAPDIDVEMTPKEAIAGNDPQLERAVAEGLRLLREHPVVLKKEPPPPVKARRPN